jgi:WXG100 family type VII secretion target
MTPPEHIRTDFPALEQIARQFDAERERIQRIQQAVSTRLSRLRNGGWESDAADEFYRSMDHDVMPGIARLVNALDEAGVTTRAILKLMQEAEEEAAAALKYTGGEAQGISDGDATKPVKEFDTQPSRSAVFGVEEHPSPGKAELQNDTYIPVVQTPANNGGSRRDEEEARTG